MDALRKVYHRAVQIPLENVERLWSELETFENSLNKITVIGFANVIRCDANGGTGQEVHVRFITIIHASSYSASSAPTAPRTAVPPTASFLVDTTTFIPPSYSYVQCG